MKTLLPNNKAARLEALRQYQILDTEPEEAFDDLARLAAHICGTPIALISLVDENRQWFKSKIGMEVTEAPLDVGLCPLFIDQQDVVVVSDALADERTRANPVVTSYPYIRFYAGVPLITPEKHVIGTLCVIDYVPREISSQQVEALRALSRQVVSQLELRRNLVGMAYCVTERKRAEEERDRFFTLSLDMLCIAGMDGYFKRLNPTWEKTLLHTNEELLTRPFLDFIHPEDQAATLAEVKKLATGTPTIYFENRYRCKDGSYKWLAWTAFPRVEEGLVYAIARDITSRKQAEEALRQSEQAATGQLLEVEKLNCLKDEFLITVSHELRTPVTNMKMAIQMLTLCLKPKGSPLSEMVLPQPLSNKIDRYLQILQNECERETNLINDLLDLQRLDTGGERLLLETICLETWLRAVAEPFQERAGNRNQTLELDLAEMLPPLVSNPSSLERIIAELLNNACKYTLSGERITLKAFVQSSTIQIQVINSGVEIPQAELPRIFDKFYRIPSTDPWKQGGTGLGLALVKKLTEHLGGRIWVVSEHGSTCFTVSLPLQGSVAICEQKAFVEKA